jgi:hypothetical protein
MNNLFVITAVTGLLVASAIGCGASSGEEQRRALTYQQNSDDAARKEQYGIAGEEQRKAHDAHHNAVTKAIDEGKPIPPQTKFGDVPPPPPTP